MTIYGKQPVLYCLEQNHTKIQRVFLAKEIDKKLFYTIKNFGIEILRVDNKKAQAMAKGGNHQGILAEVEPLEFHDFSEIKGKNFLVVLCGLTDVGNIGAIARTAYALGVDGLVVTGVNNIHLEGALRTSSGALFNLPIFYEKNPLEVVNRLKMEDFFLIGSAMEQTKRVEFASKKKKALFLGSESDGIPQKVLKKLDCLTGITMKRGFNSLNVSAAAAILMDRIV